MINPSVNAERRRILAVNLQKLILIVFIFCVTLIFNAPSPVLAEDHDKAYDSSSDKKSHRWLIAVGAGAGSGIGFLIGFRAFDEDINSERKIWTTTIVSGVAGGLIGWLIARELDKESESASVPKTIQQEPYGMFSRKSVTLAPYSCNSVHETAKAERLPLLAQIDCICPPLPFEAAR